MESNTLILNENEEEQVKYFLDCDDLTLIFSWQSMKEALLADGDSTSTDVLALYEALGFDEDNPNIRLFFKRK